MSSNPGEIGDAPSQGAVSVCHACGKRWDASLLHCPDDASPLALHTGDIEISPSLRESGRTPLVEARSETLPVGTVVGEYVVERRLGQGGMGAVYAASHPLIGKRAAIKVISLALCTDSAAVERFVQEARSVNQIGHPNIVDIFSFGELVDGRCYFVMELLLGETLGERLARSRLCQAEAIEILDQVADALDAAHEAKIVHRDLKPDNVFLVSVRGNRQLAKLLDFGIAKLAGAANEASRPSLTKTGFVMGSPGYISPEQARGRPVDHRSDVYALGALAFEMLCGKQVFTADNVTDLVILHCTEPPPRPIDLDPTLPHALDQLVVRMLEKDPAARPSMAEVRAQLQEAHAVVTSRRTAGGYDVDRTEVEIHRPPRARWPFLAALAVACAAATVLSMTSLDRFAWRTGTLPSIPEAKRVVNVPPPVGLVEDRAPSEAPPPAPAPSPEPAAAPVAAVTPVKLGPKRRKVARGRVIRTAPIVAPPPAGPPPTDDGYMLNPFREAPRKK